MSQGLLQARFRFQAAAMADIVRHTKNVYTGSTSNSHGNVVKEQADAPALTPTAALEMKLIYLQNCYNICISLLRTDCFVIDCADWLWRS